MIKSKTALVLTTILATGIIFTSGCTNTRHESTGTAYISSSATTFKVKETLLRDPGVKSAHINVTTFKDTVTLSGYVDTDAQADRAVEITRHIRGVKYVVDDLSVKNA